MPDFDPAVRKTFTFRDTLPFPPEEVFPLLCPTREHDWIAAWACDLRCSRSGLAELDAVFVTALPERVVWTVSRFEPPAAEAPGRIDFVLFQAESLLTRLAIVVERRGGGCAIEWSRVYTALDDPGRETLAALDQAAYDAKHRELDRLLLHYLRHGEAWRPPSSSS